MNPIVRLTALFALTVPAFPQAVPDPVPRTLAFQARLLDASGQPLNQQPLNLTLSLYDKAVGGTQLFTQTKSVAVTSGLVSATLGPIPDFVFDGADLFLGVMVEPDPEMTPRLQVSSVAFAQRARRVDMIDASVTLAEGIVDGAAIADGAVSSADLGIGAVAAQHVQAGAIGSPAIADGSIQTADLADGAVTAAKLDAASLPVAPNSVGGAEVIDNSLTAIDLATNSVGTAELSAGSVGSSEVIDNSLTASDLATNSVGAAEIAAGSVGSSEVLDNSLTANDLATNSVGAAEIAAGSVGSSEVIDNSLTANDLATNSVGAAEIATGAVGASELADDLEEASDDPLLVLTNLTTSGTKTGFRGRSMADQGRGVHGTHAVPFGVGNGVRGGTQSPTGYGVFANGDYGGNAGKYFLQPHPGDPGRIIRFASLEGPESGTYFRGSALVENGTAVIEVPEAFRLASEPEDLTVHVTPHGRAVTWVPEVGLERVVIHADADVRVDYLVHGVRRGFQGMEVFLDNHAFVPEERGVPFGTQFRPAYRQLLVQNGILNPDFTPNEETARRLGWNLR